MAIGGYGAHLAAKILEIPDRRKALVVIWLLAAVGVLLSGVQQVLMHRSDRRQELKQAALEEKAEKDQRQLREKLDSSLRRQEDVQQELGSILQYLHTPQPGMDSRHLAAENIQDGCERHAPLVCAAQLFLYTGDKGPLVS